MLIHDAQGHIQENIKQDKEFFRDTSFYCHYCKSKNAAILDYMDVIKAKIIFLFNCQKCGSTFQVETNEKTIYRQMINAEYTDSLECQFFDMFRVCWAYNFYNNLESEKLTNEIISRLMKKYRKRRLWYLVRYWIRNG